MNRTLKVIMVLVGVVVLLAGAAVLVLPQLLDPAAYKPRLIEEVKARTGRDLALDGDIKVSVFPWLGLELGAASLSNAPGFGEIPFASVKAIDVRVKLLPLMRKEVEMSTVRLVGLELNLARNARGVPNWTDLMQTADAKGKPGKQAEPVAPESQGSPLAALAIGGVEVKDATISWQDRQAGSDYRFKEVNLTTGPLASGRMVDLSLSFALQSQSSGLDERIELGMGLKADTEARKLQARPLRLVWRPAGRPDAPAELSGNLDIDLGAETLDFSAIKVKIANLAAEGSLQGKAIVKAPAYNGSWRIAEFNPRKLMESLALTVPETADPGVLTLAGASFSLASDTKSVQLSSLKLHLDDSRMDGEFTVRNFANPHFNIKADIDQIDLDRYLPPPPVQVDKSAGPAAGAGAAAGALPLDLLRALRLSADLRIGKLKAYGLRSSNVRMNIKAKDGDLRVKPAGAELYGGKYQGDIGLRATGKEAQLSVNERFTGVKVGDMLNDLQGKQRLSGTGDLSFQLNTQGGDVNAMRRQLDGTAAFRLRDGAVEGINIGELIRGAKAALKGRAPASDGRQRRTDFSELSGTVVFTDGVARNDDLSGKSPLMRVTGAGTADIVRADMDYLLKVVLVGTGKGQGGAELDDLKGLPVPLRIHGPFAALEYDVDLQSVLQDAAKAKVEETVRKKLERNVGDKLKGLFGR